MSTMNSAETPHKKSIMTVLSPGNWSIRWKARLNFLLRAVVAIGLLMLLVNLFQKKITLREANTKLSLLSDTKAKYLKDYFIHLDQQIKAFSTDRQILEAFNQLSSAFLDIENDSYLTSSVTGFDRLNSLLEGFYKTEILPALGDQSNNVTTLKSLLPDDNKQKILQYLYIAANTKPLGLKGNTAKADDGSAYSYLHSMYHPEMLNFARQAGISDVLFVDYKTGYVVYSIRKNLDFASNLFEGPYKNSGLGMAFKSAVALQVKSAVAYTDASIYMPALYEPQVFISTPVFSGSQLLGVVIFAINNNSLGNLLTYSQEGTSSIESLKSIVVGHDMLYRCDDPEFVQDRAKYIRKLKNHAGHGETAANVSLFGSTALVQQVDPLAFDDALKDKQGNTTYKTETGSKVYCSYAPLGISSLNWILITQIDRSDVFASMHRFILILAGIAFMIALILYYLSGLFNNSVFSRLEKLREIVTGLAKGENVEAVAMDQEDEIGFIGKELFKLSSRMKDSTLFINELSKGNIDVDFPLSGDKDQFGSALNSVKESLINRRSEEEKRKQEDEIRNWTTHGIAMFNDIMRKDTSSLENLSLNIIRNVVQYLSASQGGLFLMEEEDGNRHYLNLIAAYAFDRQKFLKKRIEIGEGLAGTCVLEKKYILTNKIPENYLSVTSGLGGSKPGCLLVVPLKKDEDVLGVIEIASFENFKPHEVEFVEKVAESIASALITVKLHLQTTQYLERFQQQAEEMKAQDEELRQNIEELQATHEQMERLKAEETERNQKMIKEMEDYRKLLISVINEVPEKIFLKDDQGRFLIANKQVADNYNKTVDEILGKSDFDFYPRQEATEYFKHEQDIINSGRDQAFEEGDPSRYDGLIVRSIKKPFYIEHLGITGLFGVQFDISDIKRKEYEANKLSAELIQKQEEIEKASVQLMKEKALLDALLNNVPEHIYFKDKQSRFLRFSKSLLHLFGLEKQEDLMGKSDFDFFSEEHSRPAYEGEQNIIKTGKAIIDLEEKNVMADGSFSWVNTTKMPLMDVNGEIIGTFGISKDITHIKNLQQEAIQTTEELKSQEEEMRQNLEEMLATQEDLKRQLEENEKMKSELGKEKALMDALMDNVPECIYFKDHDSRFLRFSRSMLKLFGLKKPEELIGKSDFDFFSDEHARPAFEDEQKIIKTGQSIIDLEEKEVMDDGRINWVNTTKMPLKDENGKIIGTFGISKSISRLKGLEMEARDMLKTIESNRKLLIEILNKVPAKVFLKDENGVFVIVNSAVASVYNKKPEQIIGTSDFDNHPGEDVTSWRKQELNIIKNGETAYIHKEQNKYLNTIKAPFVFPATGKTGLLGIQIDVTDLKIMEEEVKKLKEEVKRLRRK